jgi:hypothetical protein
MGKTRVVPERTSNTTEPPSRIGAGTIAMALAAFSMALFSYFLN